ncbi:EpsG family protein [Segatella bryantii]|uniref:EpsG family protein n=1 Tax=Segatella bryantii TaxID=77095 RepID=UPI0024201CE9|nr:EpsG family protein [Segatella bryantii]
MEPYIISFILSLTLLWLGYYNKSKKAISVTFIIIALFILSLLAGFRDETVGLDLSYYFVPNYDAARAMSSKTALVYLFSTGLEPLYLLSIYVVSQFSYDYFLYFFLQEFLSLLLILIACNIKKYNVNYFFIFAIYLFYFYCQSLSLNRQVYAVSLIFLSYPLILKKKILKFVIVIIIAILFHSSAIICLSLYPIVRYGLRPIKRSFYYYFVIVFSGGIFYFIFPSLLNFLINYGILVQKYTRYLDEDYSIHKFDILILVVLYLNTFYKQLSLNFKNGIRLLIIISFFITLCGTYNDIASRAALYFQFCVLYLFAISLNNLSKKYRLRMMFSIIIIYLVSFVYQSSTTDLIQTVPYTSRSLGI